MNFFKKISSYCLSLVMSSMAVSSFAGQMGLESPVSHPWSVTGSLGYTYYQNMYLGDGQTVVGRLALGRDLYTSPAMIWGLEVGVQNGNTMRFFPSDEAIEVLGGLPIQTTAKPILDVLVALKTASLGTAIPMYGVLKGGAAYRRWQFIDRNSISDKSQIAGEVQGGLGYAVNERASLSLLYQGIFGSDPRFSLDPFTATGQVSNIPIQHGVLLGLTINV